LVQWDYRWLSENPNITWDIVKDNPDTPWDYNWLSENPNITWEIVRDNPNKRWDWTSLSMNLFNRNPIVRAKCIEKIIPLLEPYVNEGVDRMIANYL
jgi:hypothetical protein